MENVADESNVFNYAQRKYYILSNKKNSFFGTETMARYQRRNHTITTRQSLHLLHTTKTL